MQYFGQMSDNNYFQYPAQVSSDDPDQSNYYHSVSPTFSDDLSDYMVPDEGLVMPQYQQQTSFVSASMTDQYYGNANHNQMANMMMSSTAAVNSASTAVNTNSGSGRIAFRMKSEEEIVDDGFRWRKYGKKSLKNSPSPRNYFRCASEGCSVKKRVERDKEDPSYVITTYDGAHNHISPAAVYYTAKDTTTGKFYVAGCHVPRSSSQP